MKYTPSSLICEVCRRAFHTWDGYIRHVHGGHPISGTIVVRKGEAVFMPSASKRAASSSSGEPGADDGSTRA